MTDKDIDLLANYAAFFEKLDKDEGEHKRFEERAARAICRQLGFSTSQIDKLKQEAGDEFHPEWVSERFKLLILFAAASPTKTNKLDLTDLVTFASGQMMVLTKFWENQYSDLKERYPHALYFGFVFPISINSRSTYVCLHNYPYEVLLKQSNIQPRNFKWCITFLTKSCSIHLQLLSSFINLVKPNITLSDL